MNNEKFTNRELSKLVLSAHYCKHSAVKTIDNFLEDDEDLREKIERLGSNDKEALFNKANVTAGKFRSEIKDRDQEDAINIEDLMKSIANEFAEKWRTD